MSEGEAARQFGLARETVRKMLRYSVPPGYRRQQPARRPKLDAWVGTIDQILEDDKARGKKQRHTAKRIFERLRDEHAYTGGYTIVKDYVRLRKLSQREMFVPLEHPPGDAQADFGEAQVVIGGVERKAHYLAVELPQSDDCFVMAFPAETTEAFLEGHNHAFAYFGGVPRTILSWPWRGYWAMERAGKRKPSPSYRATIYLRRSSGVRERATTRERWRAWWAMRGGTSWCRCRGARVGTS